jgi:hypothetical protein
LDTGSSAAGKAFDEDRTFQELQELREKVLERFGSYAVRKITLTRDETTTAASRRRDDQVLVSFKAPPGLVQSTARTVAQTHCKECLAGLTGLDADSRSAVVQALIDAAMADDDRAKQLNRITANSVPGAYSPSESRLTILNVATFEHTAAHEMVHALVHPAFRAAFGDEDNINEGFTEYFTRQIVSGTSYQEQYDRIIRVRDAMAGPFLFANAGGGSVEESMRLAYFRGRLDLIGWVPSGPEEEAVKEADESVQQWDAATARRYAAIYRKQAQEKQAPSSNVLGLGLFFTKGPNDKTIAVRYVRVLAQTEPFATRRLLLEGQFLGAPFDNPATLGASLGIAAEYQEPYFFAQAGLRFVGTMTPGGGSAWLDVSPVAGVGVRAWQMIRVGAEGFVLLPLTGQETQFGGGITLGIEFK